MTGSARLTDGDYRLLAGSSADLLREFFAFSEQAARGAGLVPRQYQALLAIKGSGEDGAPTIGYLADQLHIRHHSAVGLVNRLAGAGYLRRNASRTDRRQVTLALTRKGEAILEKLAAAHRTELRRLTPLLKPLLARIER